MLQQQISKAPKVAIVILNWNTWEVTRDCLVSLQKLEYSNYDTLLIDNGSSDGSAKKLSALFPDLKIIQNHRNLGFAGGNNVGIRYAMQHEAEYVLLLNNDTIVSPSFLSKMISAAEADPKIGILNPTIFYCEPSDRIWYAGGGFNHWRGFAQHYGMRKRGAPHFLRSREVTFITGCAFLIRSEVISRIGLLDENFFLVCEDTDWSLRALQNSFYAMYVADAVIWHKESFTIKERSGKWVRDFYNIRNALLIARKHARFYHWPSFLMFLMASLVWRTTGYGALGQFRRIGGLYRGLFHGIIDPIDGESSVINPPERIDVAS